MDLTLFRLGVMVQDGLEAVPDVAIIAVVKRAGHAGRQQESERESILPLMELTVEVGQSEQAVVILVLVGIVHLVFP